MTKPLTVYDLRRILQEANPHASIILCDGTDDWDIVKVSVLNPFGISNTDVHDADALYMDIVPHGDINNKVDDLIIKLRSLHTILVHRMSTVSESIDRELLANMIETLREEDVSDTDYDYIHSLYERIKTRYDN